MSISLNRGGVAFLIISFCLYLAELTARRLFHDDSYYLVARWPIPAGLLLAALVIRLLSGPRVLRKPELDHKESDYCVSHSGFDAVNQQEVFHLSRLRFFRDVDTFFVIPVRFWPWVLAVLAAILFCVPLKSDL